MDEQDFKLLHFIFYQRDKRVSSILVNFNAYPETIFDTEKRIEKLISKELIDKIDGSLVQTIYTYKTLYDYQTRKKCQNQTQKQSMLLTVAKTILNKLLFPVLVTVLGGLVIAVLTKNL